jgi:hypothetical protein
VTNRLDRPPNVPPWTLVPNDPGWGWAASLLPFLEQSSLAWAIDFSLPVQSATNLNARLSLLRLYTCPSDRYTGVFTVLSGKNMPLADAATNSYAACYGTLGNMNLYPDAGNGVFYRNSWTRIADITDGTSNTLALGERASLFVQAPWAGVMTGGSVRTTPGAPVYRSMIEPPQVMVMARVGKRPFNDPNSEPYDFFSPHTGMVYFVLVDGSVHGLTSELDLNVIQALGTRNGGEPLGSGDF